ncbi:clostripain-related cysteine peptidase [Acetobacterium bakii]|nr:clostripain-related cysteine peptidase [Acetobacterium bakii]
MKRKLLVLIVVLTMIMALTGCSDDIGGVSTHTNKGLDTSLKRSTDMVVDTNGTLNIQRLARTETTKMGASGTWTIFVYMCGSDLESEEGLATMDLQEMLDASKSDKLKFIVQTGGSNAWDNDLVNDSRMQRFVIQNQEIEEVDDTSLSNMGSAETLADFLVWGVENYPAEKMGLVFWNHGGGSITGVCFDEQNDSDSLSLIEIENALTSVCPNMTDSFEFIGFDACLMGTLETANVIAPHARYMYSSEELEPGYGWDYKAIANYIGANPTASGADLGVVVVDSFYDACVAIDSGDEVTLSCIDLSKIDALVYAFNDVAETMYHSTDNTAILSGMVKGITSAENYGGNNKSEGYTNMVDLGSILKNVSVNVAGTDQVLSALKDCVTYMKNGTNKSDSNGLAIYYPLSIQGSEELSIFKDVCVSPYYMSFVDKMVYASDTNGTFDNYSDVDWLGADSIYWNDSYVAVAGADYWSNLDDSATADYNFSEEETAISFSVPPALNAEGMYGFTIAPDTLNYVDAVYCDVFVDSGDGETLIELGLDDNITSDWSTGSFEDNFTGYWVALPDGQPLASYIVEQGDNYNIYTSPIMLNDVETNLRIRLDYVSEEEYTIKIIGAWDGIDEETGQSAKEITKLKKGDIITPMYYSYNLSNDEEGMYIGDEYVFDNDPVLYEELLAEGDYYYSFQIDDIFGSSLYTDFEIFSLDADGGIYFYEE